MYFSIFPHYWWLLCGIFSHARNFIHDPHRLIPRQNNRRRQTNKRFNSYSTFTNWNKESHLISFSSSLFWICHQIQEPVQYIMSSDAVRSILCCEGLLCAFCCMPLDSWMILYIYVILVCPCPYHRKTKPKTNVELMRPPFIL